MGVGVGGRGLRGDAPERGRDWRVPCGGREKEELCVGAGRWQRDWGAVRARAGGRQRLRVFSPQECSDDGGARDAPTLSTTPTPNPHPTPPPTPHPPPTTKRTKKIITEKDGVILQRHYERKTKRRRPAARPTQRKKC